jgi:hypothetical protein
MHSEREAEARELLAEGWNLTQQSMSEKSEIEQWLAVRKEAALRIDPETAEVFWRYGQTLDPYGVCDEWELPEEFHQVGREYFARAPGSDVWVHFSDLPDDVEEELWARDYGLERNPIKLYQCSRATTSRCRQRSAKASRLSESSPIQCVRIPL